MVSTSSAEKALAPVTVRLPVDPSWEDLSLGIGIPGAVGAALGISALAMWGAQGNPLAWLGAAILIGGYFSVMAVLWVGVATARRAP